MRTRSLVVITLLFFSAGVLATHQVGRLYPFVFLIVFPLGILGVILCDTKNQVAGRANQVLLLILSVAVSYRLYIYFFPATAIGMDVDTHIVLIHRLMDTGSISVIDRYFYNHAPIFYIYPALFGIISGTVAKNSLIVYPIAFPIVAIFSTYILSSNFTSINKDQRGLLATCFVAVGTISSYYSFSPVPQSLSVLQLVTIFILIPLYFKKSEKRYLIAIFLILVSSIYTHKIVVLMSMFIFFGYFLMLALEKGYFDTGINADGKMRDAILLAATLGAALVLQYFYITNFGRVTLFRLFGLEYYSIISSDYAFSSVKPTLTPQIYKTISDKMHLFISLPIAGLGWLHLFRSKNKNDMELWVLAASAITVFFIAVALFNPLLTNTYTRYFLFGSVFIFSLISYILANSTGSKHLTKGVQILFLVIMFSQIFTATAIPDYPTQNREYLTSAEVDAWDHSLSMVPGDIYTDYFYADYLTPTTASNDIQYGGERLPEGPPAMHSHGRSILNGTVDRDVNYILYREDIEIYFTAYGKWRLDWRMGNYLEKSYSKTYSNGEVSLYVKTTSDPAHSNSVAITNTFDNRNGLKVKATVYK